MLVQRPRLSSAPALDEAARSARVAPRLIDWARRYHAARGLYRVFGPAGYRIYRSDAGPPAEGDEPWATSAALPASPEDAFGDGTWWLSVSYSNGVVDSGFLPIGPTGETYRLLVVDGGEEAAAPPAAPIDVRLELRAGGVVRVVALYAQGGPLRATAWAIAYTVDGSPPDEDAPTVVQAFARPGGIELLARDLPAQPHGTTVRVRVQVRRGASAYSVGSTVLEAVADAQGPTQVPGGDLWLGQLPEEVV
ncbi:MAG: hypothetical protein KF878_00045 [Planctomycetes bacterium]|nr:hypothetical protein [Planctomycetota bacterium]